MGDTAKFNQQAADARKQAQYWRDEIDKEQRESQQRLHDYDSKIKDHQRIAADHEQRAGQATQAGQDNEAQSHRQLAERELSQVQYWTDKIQEEKELSTRKIGEYLNNIDQENSKADDYDKQASEAIKDEEERKKKQAQNIAIQVANNLDQNNQ